MLADYHVHALGHDHFKHTAEDFGRFLENARFSGLSEMGVADHDRYFPLFDFDALRRTAQGYPDLRVRIGVEVDFHPGEEQKWAAFIREYDLDFVIGSVHDLGTWTFDHPNNVKGFDRWDLDELYRQYFSTVEAAVRSRLFSTIGHLDLIKIWGHRPKSEILELIDPLLKILAEYDQCIEINTNGWHKPVGEVYPSREIIARCFDYGIPITLSSDAHAPEQVGRDIARAADLAREAGYRHIAGFEQRRRIMIPL